MLSGMRQACGFYPRRSEPIGSGRHCIRPGDTVRVHDLVHLRAVFTGLGSFGRAMADPRGIWWLRELSFALVEAADIKPLIVFDTGGKFDKSFNEGVANGAERFKEETGVAPAEFEVANET